MTDTQPPAKSKKRRSDYIERPLCACGCGVRVKRLSRKWCKGHRNVWPSGKPWAETRRRTRKMPRPLCLCGCGEPVLQPHSKWCQGHWTRVHHEQLWRPTLRFGAEHPGWKGGRWVSPEGYTLLDPSLGEERYEHREFARRALGRPPGSAVVFAARPRLGKYINGSLVIGPDDAYRALIQRRARAYDATGDADKRWCMCCGTWDDLATLQERVYRGCTNTWHKECANYAAHLRYFKLPKTKRGATYRQEALEWKQYLIDRQARAIERARERPLRGKCGGTRKIRRSDARGGAIDRIQLAKP